MAVETGYVAVSDGITEKLNQIKDCICWYEKSVKRAAIALAITRLLVLITNFAAAVIAGIATDGGMGFKARVALIALPLLSVLLNGIVSELGLTKWVAIREEGRLRCFDLQLALEDHMVTAKPEDLSAILKKTSRELIKIEKDNARSFLGSIKAFRFDSKENRED